MEEIRKTSGNENSQSLVYSDPNEPENGQEDPLCNPGDSATLSETGGSEENPSSDYVIIDEPKSEQKDCSSNLRIEESYLCDEEKKLVDSPHVSDSSSLLSHETNIEHLDKAEENLLQGKLLSLNLSREDIHFILEQGDKFLERPPLLLAKKLGIDPITAKATIEALKSFKNEKTTNHISQDDRISIEDCLRENPEFTTPGDIALLTDIPIEVITKYLQYRPLDGNQKTEIKKKVNIGNSVDEIAVLLKLPPNKVQEYVDKTFITFTRGEGKKCFDIIHKNFDYSSTFQLRKLVISNDLKLRDQLCHILLKRNEREHIVLKRYFQKFEESRSFFEVKDIYLTFDDIHQINQSSDIEHLSIKLNKPASINILVRIFDAPSLSITYLYIRNHFFLF